ncbi:MAG: endolytic transglycosylase MltG [Oscillospiraceae bacterium]|jgi:UPF0755 protein|nr:endolytic transglycosylase MltG [Oscillospiraceae bacterium]
MPEPPQQKRTIKINTIQMQLLLLPNMIAHLTFLICAILCIGCAVGDLGTYYFAFHTDWSGFPMPQEGKRLEKHNTSSGAKARRETEYKKQSQAKGQTNRPIPRGEDKRKGPFGALVYLALIIGISTLLAGLSWVAINDVLALNKEENASVVVIEEDDTMGEIASQLKEAEIIEYKSLFQLYCNVSKAREKITPGTYELSTTMDYRAIVAAMGKSSSSRITVSVTIPEGYTLKQIFELLEEKGVSSYKKLEEMAATYDYNFSFLQDIPLGEATRLEGYLFPDTYDFYLGEDSKTVLNKMLVNFDSKVTAEMREQATKRGYSVHEIIVIASMIEKETTGADQKNIASVIYNRLNSNNFQYLQVDATVQYALKERKEKLSLEDLEVDSPYNTYKYEGLPAGPIANPGLVSINAALNPAKTNYYYYALGEDNMHHFFRTFREHQTFVNTLPND